MTNLRVDIDRLKNSVDLRNLAGSYTKLRHHHADEYVGACPFCGGTKRCGYHQDWFYCRDCRKSGDAIGFLMSIAGIDFLTACGRLSAEANLDPSLRVEPAPKAPRQSRAEWIADAVGTMRRAVGKLTYSEPVRSYLEGRKLKPSTWAAFGLGAAVLPLPGTWDDKKREGCYPSQPAVALPWVDRAGDVLGIRYRFTEKHTYTDLAGNKKEDVRLKSKLGSRLSCLFGWQAIEDGDKSGTILVIVEGEINAMSIWQMAKEAEYAIDVLSIGSEGQRPEDLGEIASPYAGVIVWADKLDVAKDLRSAINGASGVFSPNGMDANDLLVAGQLQGYMDAWIRLAIFDLSVPKELEPEPEFQKPYSEEGRLWDLWERYHMHPWGRLDDDEYIEMCQLGIKTGLWHPTNDPNRPQVLIARLATP